MSQTCTDCKIEKEFTEFYRNRKTRSGYQLYCKKCSHKRVKKYRNQHPNKAKEYRKQYYVKNREIILARDKVWYAKNKDKTRVSRKRWKQRNPEIVSASSYKYHRSLRGRYTAYRADAGVRGVEFKLTAEEFAIFWMKPCHYCDSSIETIRLDRIDSTKGYLLDNVVPCCKRCNYAKVDKTQAEFVLMCCRVAKNHSMISPD